MLYGLGGLLPSAGRGTEGVSEGDVFSMGEQLLYRLGVAFDELLERQLILLDYAGAYPPKRPL
jgi:hypothetical protein